MCLAQGRGNLYPDVKNFLSIELATLQSIRQALTFEKFHDKIVNAVVVTDIIQRAYVGVIQTRNGFCFTLKSLPCFITLQERLAQDLERPRRVSVARYTSPMPPAPAADTISYGPSLLPGDKVTSDAPGRRISVVHPISFV
jgi:hypothetical protein